MTVNLSALAGAGQQFFDNNGVPLSGGKLYSYAAGTTTPQTTYITVTGAPGTEHTNPIILDSAGRVSSGQIWLSAGLNYKFVLKTSTEVPIASWDNITGINGTGIAVDASNVSYIPAGNFTETNLQDALDELTTSSGASVVGYLPAGTGAIATDVQEVLRRTVSVKDFGAVGDGVTDDTASFVAATALNAPVFVPQSTSFYAVTALTAAQQKLLYGVGVVKIAGVQTQISTAPYIDNDTANIRVVNQELQPSKWPTVDGSLFNGAVSARVKRTGGFGSYGVNLVEYLISDSTPAGEFDVGMTSWVTNQNLAGGQVFGQWAGANTPSNELAQTYSGGAAIGQETNVGNRWADFGLLNSIGATRYTVGHQIVPDVLPAPDGETVAVYPGSFAEVIAKSVHGHKWWTGILVASDAIMPNGRVFNIIGGSSVGNKTGVIVRATDNFTRGLDFSGATFSNEAFLLGASQSISWNGTTMNGTATTFGLSTGAGTGDAALYASDFDYMAIRWNSSGSAARIGFFGAAAVERPSSTGETAGFTQGSGTSMNADSSSTGNAGTTAYTFGDVVKHLKNLGLIAL